MTVGWAKPSGPPRGARPGGGAFIRSLAPVVFATFAVIAADRLVRDAQDRSLHESVQRELVPTARSLAASIDRRTALLHGLTSFLAVEWNNGAVSPQFTAFANRVVSETPGILAVAVTLPDGTPRFAWPDSAAPGLLAPPPNTTYDNEAQDLRFVVNRGTVVLSGPRTLPSGRSGLVARLAVRDRRDSARTIAIASITMDLDSVAAEAGIDSIPGMMVQVRSTFGEFIAGERNLGTDMPDPRIVVSVIVDGETWNVQAVPAGGWSEAVARNGSQTRIAVGFASLLLCAVAWIFGDRRRALAELEQQRTRQRAEQKFVKLFAMTPDGVVLSRESDGTILEVNPGFSDICKRSREELLGRRAVDLGLWASEGEREAFRQRIVQERDIHDLPVVLARPDGEVRETRLSARLFDLDGERCIIAIIRDVHDQRKLEKRLAEGERLEAVGRLAGGVAHDFNNLITGIAGFTAMLQEHLRDDALAQSDLHEISRASTRAANLTKQLLAFARRQVVEPRIIDLNDLVLESNGLLRSVIGERITLTTSLSPVAARVMMDPSQMDQLLHNLAVNARDAMPSGGTIRIQVLGRDHEVHLMVTDTGLGIPDEILPHLFEPFYTTKAMGKGTGLGLATCYGIMQQAGGRIEVQSTPGQGTTFTLVFPKTVSDVRTVPEDPLPLPPVSTGQTILLAEDESQIRLLCERLLRSLGYRVLSAEHGAQALEIAASHQGRIDLLLTDMVMPVMGGAELMKRIREVRPDIRLLMMSGYSDDLLQNRPKDVPFLGKPFTPGDLAAAVQGALSQ